MVKKRNETEREDNLTEHHRNGRNKIKITIIVSIESENKSSATQFSLSGFFFLKTIAEM